MLSSGAEEISSSEMEAEPEAEGEQEENEDEMILEEKEIHPKDIWHSEIDGEEEHEEEPFGTDKATVYLNITAQGDPEDQPQAFDWISSIDSSGSMDWNDPEDERIDAAQHFVTEVETTYEEHHEEVGWPRGATIDFDSSAFLINDRHLSSQYDAIRSDIEVVDSDGGTDFVEPMEIALEEFQHYGNPDFPDFHLFLTDGQPNQGGMDWDLVDEHADRDIPMYTIGFGNIDEQLLQEMADRSGGEFYECDGPDELEEVFEEIFERILTQDETAVETPMDDAMIKEKLPPYLEYVEGSAELEAEPEGLEADLFINEAEGILEVEPYREGEPKMNIDDHISLKYEVRASEYSHDLPITAYDDDGYPESRITYLERGSGEKNTIYTAGPRINVHGYPEPVVGGTPWHGVGIQEPVVFENMSENEKTTWPGDCKPESYRWETEDGEVYHGSGDTGEAEEEHQFADAGPHDIELTATTHCGVSKTATGTIEIMSPQVPPSSPPPPPSSPPPPGMGIANPTATPLQVGVGNPMATPTPTGVPQPTATPQMTMQPMATSQPVSMPTTTAIFSGLMPVAAQKNPAEKIKMSVKNLN